LKYQIIINENAKSGKIKKSIPDLIELFKTHLENFEFHITKNINELVELNRFTDNSFDAVIAVGGDGTFNGIINNFPYQSRKFGLIPFGTGNDFPLMLGLKGGIREAIELIKSNKIKNLDLGHLKTEKYEKYFINAVGIGFDAKVGYTKNKITFMNGGLSKYIISLLSSLISYHSSDISVLLDNYKNFNRKCFLLTIGNGKRTGGGFLLTPDAIIDDGKFDICLVNDINKLKVIRHFPKVLNGKHLSIKQVEMFQSSGIKILSNNELFLHFDGETLEKVKEIEIGILPKEINVFSF
jgi:diacylglycerol kinase (ATP)